MAEQIPSTDDFSTLPTKTGGRPVALIAGPTASGKSALALRLAESHDGIVINCDASQVYADLALLSARPDAGELARAPHRLFGHIDGAEACSAARWAAEAKAAIAAAHAADRLPILVGGTGLYIRTLIDGIAPVPDIDPAIRAAVRALPVAQAHAALRTEDPQAAARLNPADTTRVARALEVVRSTGRPIHAWQAEMHGGIGDRITLHPLLLLPDRQWLVERCDARFDAMIAGGAAEEVRALLTRHLDPDLPVMRAIGVRPIAQWLAGEIDAAAMADRAKRDTRRYAKRQYTWFANQSPAHWPRASETQYDDYMAQLVIKLHTI
ncbi:tRNA (adenosine(37)-N6)-dimethylallyltransferase MiaA [Sphingobium sufflavum]|uniref:tRNA (adenosine(37)-N6)-dimethylallyltransferase MiaA n=1 Tax=Sphingobium sufflavum TaxID=1129547 RepID=UPI001F008FA9|nr:tRNA (adenosine(37)-N6)-dimethylallyltransferase MiaA [Sphingobium sufflavum]MCE7798227.1 tRNA (adenosine(37)-N6)-dimethylallyltransferase MiaA [Sphingobium sufflavum]